MKKINLLTPALLLCTALSAQEKMYIHQADKFTLGVSRDKISSIYFGDNESKAFFELSDSLYQTSVSNLDSLSFGESSTIIQIRYSDSGVEIINPLAFEGINISTNGNYVTVNSTTSSEVEYVLSGTTSDGAFKLYAEKKYTLTLNGVNITSTDGPAINIQSGKKCTVNVASGTTNSLVDGSTYTACGEEDMKGCFFSEGQLIFSGGGTLNVKGNKKHGICSDDYILISDATINVTDAASDAIHVNDYFKIENGNITLSSQSDGIDAGGYVYLNGGYVNVTLAQADVKGIKADTCVYINGGTIIANITGDQSKAFKAGSDIQINGGDITITASGNVVVTDYDPSYCTGFKAEGNFIMNDGKISITSTGKAGKGISADGNVNIYGGEINITASGAGAKYLASASSYDSYSATCIKADTNILLAGGTITTNCTSTASAGKGISADGTLTIGESTAAQGPTINITTQGSKFLVSGSGNNADYANPKAIKSESTLTINAGSITVTTKQDGGEGIESKSEIIINGGTIEATTYDDAINAAKAITINDGKIYCYASGNDGIDSNGTITINGGLIISSGTTAPEEGMDCDQNTFTINGGILIGTGGATSYPNKGTQKSIVYSGSGTANQIFRIQTSSGEEVLTYKIPRTYSSMTMLFSSSALVSGSSYVILTGGSLSGEEYFHGYYQNATYTGGTQSSTFTQGTSYYTTVGNAGGGTFPGGGGGGGHW